MKKIFRNLIVSASQVLAINVCLSHLCFAGAPAKYPSCEQAIKMKLVPNSSGVYFDEACTVAYVLPPNQGKIEIKGLAPNMNLKLCGAYESSLRVLQNEYSHLERISQQLEKASASGDSKGDPSDDTNLDTPESAQPILHSPKLAPASLLAEYQKTLDMIEMTQKSLRMFEDDKKGVAVGKINYFTKWSELVVELQKANPKLHFERLPLEAGRIVFGRKLGVAGEVVTGSVTQNIQGIENTSGISPEGTLNSSSGSVIMGDAITGQIVLNFAGACPFMQNGKMPTDLSSSEVDAYLAANFQYKYSLQGLRKYRASYNLASIAKHIQESRTTGGFFTSSTTNSVIDSNSSNDEFKMEIESNQSSYEFDASLRAEVKIELINRVLREMALATGQNILLPTQTAPSAHGAVVAADELQKVPNPYAQIGAVALRVLDSIFGNSSAVASYVREKNGVSIDNVLERRMFNYNGSMVFSGSTK